MLMEAPRWFVEQTRGLARSGGERSSSAPTNDERPIGERGVDTSSIVGELCPPRRSRPAPTGSGVPDRPEGRDAATLEVLDEAQRRRAVADDEHRLGAERSVRLERQGEEIRLAVLGRVPDGR